MALQPLIGVTRRAPQFRQKRQGISTSPNTWQNHRVASAGPSPMATACGLAKDAGASWHYADRSGSLVDMRGQRSGDVLVEADTGARGLGGGDRLQLLGQAKQECGYGRNLR